MRNYVFPDYFSLTIEVDAVNFSTDFERHKTAAIKKRKNQELNEGGIWSKKFLPK